MWANQMMMKALWMKQANTSAEVFDIKNYQKKSTINWDMDNSINEVTSEIMNKVIRIY